jgi:hypothetical protein
LLVLALGLAIPAEAAEWVRVETPNFTVFGQAGEKRTKEVAAEFERFREAIGQVLPSAATGSAVPTTVVVFESQKAFAPYKPRYNGKPVVLSGYFFGTENANSIALAVDDRENALRIIFHEYTHLITSSASRGLPPWLSEGLAEFYSTFAVAADGKGAVLGKVIPSHYVLLGQNALLPLDQLLAVDRSSALYNEGQRRSIFYAQSWGLVHMFLAGEPKRSKELGDYMRLTAGGTSSLDAWRQSFGEIDANKELKRYLARPTVNNFVYKFEERVAAVTAQVSRPAAADVEAVLASLLRYAAPDEAAAQLQRAVEMTPPSGLARALMGVTMMRSGDRDEGTKLLLEAAADTSDWLAQYYVATGLIELTRALGRGAEDKTTAAAKRAVDAVLAVRPGLAHALALKGHLQRGTDGAATVARARALAPGREDYVFLEAQLRTEAREFPAARNILSVLLTPRFPPDVRDRARNLMGYIVQMERYYADRPEAGSADPNLRLPTPDPSIATAVFRELKPGEQRLQGLLERLECSQTGTVTLVVRTGGQLQRFRAASFSDIDFITYREGEGGSINCGDRRPPDLVYLTWVTQAEATAGISGRPVAVEFLPVR